MVPLPLPPVSLPASIIEINDALVPPLTFEEELTLAKVASEATRPYEPSAGVKTDSGGFTQQGGLGSILDPFLSLPGLEAFTDLAAVRIASGPYARTVLDTVLQPAIRDALKSSTSTGGAAGDGDPRARMAVDAVSESLRSKAEGRIRRAGSLARRN